MYPQTPQGGGTGGHVLTRDEYWKTKVLPFLRFCVLGGGMVCFFMAFMTLISMGVFGLLDGLLIAGLGFGICFRRSRACAVIAGVYYALNFLMMRMLPIGAAMAGTAVVTYIFIALFVLSIYGTFTFQSNYAAYVASHLTSRLADDGSADETRRD